VNLYFPNRDCPPDTLRISLAVVLLLAFALRVAAALYWHHQASEDQHYFRLPDSHSYWMLAQQIADGQPYQYGGPDGSVYRTPLLPLLLAPLTWIPDAYWSVLSARFLGAVLGTLAVYWIAALAGRLGGVPASLVAGLLAAVYPSAIGMSLVILSEMLFIPLMVLQLLLWHGALDKSQAPDSSLYSRSLAMALGSGIVAGLACLTRPSWLLFTPCLAVGCALVSRHPRHRSQVAAVALIGMCATMAPWWIRNANVTDQFVATTLQVGPSLLDGLRADATGASDSDMKFMIDVVQRQKQLDAQSDAPLDGTFEWRVNRLATLTAIGWATENPTLAVRLGIKKFIRIWSLWPDGKELASNSMRLAITVSSFSILLLATLVSIRMHWPSNPMLAALWLPCLYFTALHMVFVGSVRYREPAIFLLIVLAGLVNVRQMLLFLYDPRQTLREPFSLSERTNLRWQAEPHSASVTSRARGIS